MGAGGLGGGGKRNANVELNLVPFIDLLSTLICFLLITAVWQQLAVLSTNSSSPSANENPQQENKVDLSVSLLLDHIQIAEGQAMTNIPHIGKEPDYATLERKLAELKVKYPTRSDLTLHSDSQAPYKQLIKLMDTMTGARFSDVAVNTN
jgi:biopolymer transport protein TolR